MKKIALVLFAMLMYSQLFGQNQASYWYFGQNAGLRFNADSGNVTAITDGQINTLEGCTSISDPDGNLLFYSDGRTVWNRNHQMMPNGNYFAGTGLLGDPSSTSSGLIVPKPEDPTQYYIFTVDEPHHENAAVYPNQFIGPYNNGQTIPVDDDGFNNGLNYSLVDMNLNGGLGNVDTTEKNVPLVTYDVNDPEAIKFKCSEKITAVRAEDCGSFWVITHFMNSFYAFKVGASGVDTTPVISTVGPNISIEGYRRNALGYIKASPDASKLIVAHYGFSTSSTQDAPGGVYLYDFNNATGVLSNNIELYGPQNNNSPYGVEFSAENKKAYATIGLGPSGNGASQVVQWDLETEDIPASMQVIYTSNNTSPGALQLGIDRRIYRAQFSFSGSANVARYLGIISNPEADGMATNYNEQGILLDINGLNQNTSRIGLPPFIQSLFNSQIDIIRNNESTTELKLCTGDNYTLRADAIAGADYFWSIDGAPLVEDSFELVVDSPGFYEVYIEPNNGDCPILGSAVVGEFDIPVANPVSDIVVCDDDNDGIATFSFSDKDEEVLFNQDPNQFNTSYFVSLDDATNDTNKISLPFENTTNPQEIFVRVDNRGNTNCFDITSFEIEVFNTPQILENTDLEFCDNEGDSMDGIASVDLSELILPITGSQDNTEVSFYTSQENADNKASPLPFSYTNTTPFVETIFIRVENTNNLSCFSTSAFNIVINPAPIANNTMLIQCDEDGIPEGFTTFNLTEVLVTVTSNNSNVSVNYYTSQTDAVNQENAINANAFENFLNPQTVYARVTDSSTGCFSFSEVTLEVSTTSTNDTRLERCDDDGAEDGFTSFNLSEANPSILAGITNSLDIAYYETYEDALVESNPLGTTFTNIIPYSQTIYARAENSNACYGISEIELIVFELPNIETEFDTQYCLNFFPEPLVLDAGVTGDLPNNYFYLWSTSETTSSIAVNTPGTYSVRVSNTNGCYKDRSITVVPSNIATIEDIDVVDASQNNKISVFVSGEGDYEYALDSSVGPYQDSNTFENVQPGLYTVYVRDKNNCGVVENLVSVIGFPKFFTPNNDNNNDYWQVYGITSQFQANTSIFIFDRYGKLLTELNPLGQGWDGTYNGVKMPTADYWFKVSLEDGRTFTSHFTLKR